VIPESYFPVLLFILVGGVFGAFSLLLGRLAAPHNPDAEKNAQYECGFPAFGDARVKFDVRYYLIAILFILFDLETAFLFPWAAVMREVGWPGLIAMLIFILELAIGFWYIWKRGALDWE
jgi:NADH-quinone oxidoreductase subunit A